MSDRVLPPLSNQEKQPYQEVGLGRPLSIDTNIAIAHQFQSIEGLTKNWNWNTGLVYAAGSEVARAKNFGDIAGIEERLDADQLMDYCVDEVTEADLLKPAAYEPLEIPTSHFEILPKGNFSRLVVKTHDLPSLQYKPVAGQVLGEKISVARKYAPNGVPKANRPFRDISHEIPIAVVPRADSLALAESVRLANQIMRRKLPTLELLGFGSFDTLVRVAQDTSTRVGR